MKTHTHWGFCLLVHWSLCLSLWSEEVDQAKATLVDQGPVLDGKLDDPCWKGLPVIKDFRQRRPNEGMPETEKTEVRLCRDAHVLFIGVRCFDSQPDQIRAGVMQRDAPVRGDDYFFILIDPFSRGRDGYYFRTNANGAKGEITSQCF